MAWETTRTANPAPAPGAPPRPWQASAHNQVLAVHLVVRQVEDAELLEVVVVLLLDDRAAVWIRGAQCGEELSVKQIVDVAGVP